MLTQKRTVSRMNKKVTKKKEEKKKQDITEKNNQDWTSFFNKAYDQVLLKFRNEEINFLFKGYSYKNMLL